MTYDDKPWLKSYDPGVEPEVEIPDTTLVDKFKEITSQFPDNPAAHFLGITLNYRDLMAHSDRFAQALMDKGCGPGDVVGLNLANVPQALIAMVGSLKAGCAISGVSPLLTPRELAYQLKDCKAKALVTLDAIFEHRLKGIADELPDLKFVVGTGILDFLPGFKRVLGRLLKKVPHGKVGPLPGKDVTKFMDILREYPAQSPDVEVKPQDTCLVQYTGGTTGLPKGTILTHRNMVANLTQIQAWNEFETGNEIMLSCFPFFHLAGLGAGIASLYSGLAQVLIPNPRDTKSVVSEMAKYQPTITYNVPSLYMMLLEEPGFDKVDFSRLQVAVSGASPFPAESIRALEAVIGSGKVLEGFGMTETSPAVTTNPRRGPKKIGSVGLPISSTRVRLMDLDTGTKQVPFGEEGEIVVAGPQVMKGYLNKPEESAIALREHDGETWLHTGDVARMDEDGFFFIVDRAKDMLIVSGFKVFSREVEEKLYEHPAIELCAIIGVPNPKRPGSEIVKLVVQKTQAYQDRNEDQVKEEIIAFSKENMSPYKVPKIIEFIDEIPLTAVGKVDKKVLR